MPWDTTRPVNPKYHTAEHRRQRKAMTAQLQRDGYLTCRQPECVMASRTIYPTDQWCAGHDATGTAYIGAVHRTCNEHDAGKRGRDRQRGRTDSERWTL